jgi:glycine betaine/choline ABC-type transport system substrate-binding protein
VEGWGAAAGDYTLNINASYLGLEDGTKDLLKIYPNPAKSNLTIEGLEGQLTIFAINGEQVMEVTVINETTLDISHLTSGFYTLSFVANSMQFTKKLTIE